MADPRTLAAATGVGVFRGDRWLLHNVDLSVSADEVVTLIGPNGGGKTTLVRALLGLIRLDAGRVDKRSGLRVGYLPQRFSVDRTLPLPVHRLMTLTGRHSRAEIVDALAETGVADRLAAPVQALSGGELQRVLLARALLRKPDLLVLDEPVQGVDFAGEASLYELIGAIRRRHGCGVLMVSHDLHVVMAATDRVVCLNQHVCCAGPPDEVDTHPEYARLFGPRAARAFAVYPHDHDHDHTLAGEVVPYPVSSTASAAAAAAADRHVGAQKDREAADAG